MRRIVIKIGGAALTRPLDALWSGIARLQRISDVILVHGGGPQATEMALRLGHKPRIVEGRRVTSDLDLDIVKWVVRGELNLDLVAAAGGAGIRALGISGADSGLVQVEKRPLWSVGAEQIDFGHVGDFVKTDVTALLAIISAGILPVICPPGVDASGNLYNINADTIALELAATLQADELILVTESGAILDAEGEPLRRLSQQNAICGIENGWINGGMKVKAEVGYQALKRGVARVWITSSDSIANKKQGTQLLGENHG